MSEMEASLNRCYKQVDQANADRDAFQQQERQLKQRIAELSSQLEVAKQTRNDDDASAWSDAASLKAQVAKLEALNARCGPAPGTGWPGWLAVLAGWPP